MLPGNAGAKCNDGGPGDGCQTDAACNDPAAPHCAELISVPGIITVATCGQCETNADCPQQAPHCTPSYGNNLSAGQRVCRATGSVPNNSGCDLDGTGDQACASGHCGEATLMGLLELGVCGECNANSDCGPGGQCSPPYFVDGLPIGATCQ